MKIYLTDKLDYQLDINNLLAFEGYVFDCYQLEPYNHEIQVGHNTKHNGYTFRYCFNIKENDYNFFRDKINKVMMCWIVTDDFIYSEDLKTGLKCFLDYHFNNQYFIAKLRMMHYPLRIKNQKQI